MARILGDAFVRIRPDTSTFGPEASRGLDGSSRTITSKMGTIAKRAGVALGVASAVGLAAFTKNAAGLEAEFGKTMNQLAATTGAPKREMRSLSALALKMGADTAFSASDASQAMLELARGGMTAATIKGGALQGTLTLAAAGELDMATAANVAVKSMGQFNLKGSQMDAVAAALAGGANASSASVSDMAQALAQGGLAANSVGFSIQETTGILAAFSNAGLEGSDAGTSLKTALDRLVPTTDKQSKAMRELGIITKDGRNQFLQANGEYRSAAQIAGVLQKATEGLSASERKRAISTIFGSDAQRAATVLAKEGAGGIRQMVKATSDQDAAQRMAQANMKGTEGALERMRGSVVTASLAWGQAIKPVTIFGAKLGAEIANGAVPIIQDLGRVARTTLKDFDFSTVSKALKNIDIGAVFARIKSSMTGIDWPGIKAGFSDLGTSIKSVNDPLGPFNDLFRVSGVVLRFAARNTDMLAKALPWLAAGFVAVKVAQAAANVVQVLSVPMKVAELVVNRQLVRSNKQLVASRGAQAAATVAGTGATAASTVATGANAAVTSTATRMTLRHRLAMVASAVATRAMAVATKIAAVAMRVFNAVLRMNPIGLIVTALLLLGAGLVLAYKKSETFRRIVDAAWAGVKKAVKVAWEGYIRPVMKAYVGALKWAWEGAQKLWQVTKSAWSSVRSATRSAVLWVADKVLWMAEKMLGAMVKAFGWVKGVGPKLRAALGEVQKLRVGVNREFDKIKDKKVTVTINAGVNARARGSIPLNRLNAGGQVRGGVPGRDSVPALLTPGEHVLTDDEVKKAGGHRAIFALRRMIKRGEFHRRGDIGWTGARRYAQGGPVFDLDIKRRGSLTAPIIAMRDQLARSMAATARQALLKAAREMMRKLGGVGKLSGYEIARGQRFARSQVGKPYAWGGAGPGGYDCSGFVSAVLNAALGMNPHSRRGSTATMPWPGFKPGGGSFAAGWFTGNPGHMAGTIGGLNIESAGGVGVRTGGAARSAKSFSRVAHFDGGGYARGRGVMIKVVIKAERTLDPRTTVAFEELVDLLKAGGARRGGGRVEFVITNWAKGTGYMRAIAEDTYDTLADFDDGVDRMSLA